MIRWGGLLSCPNSIKHPSSGLLNSLGLMLTSFCKKYIDTYMKEDYAYLSL
jgi:hypothetical protein